MAQDAYQIVTDAIIAQLEAGVCPWRKPWVCSAQGMPQNAVSKRTYRGVNTFLLGMMPFGDPRWLTYKQAQELGGNVKAGEKSSPCVFWKWLDFKNENEAGEEQSRTVPMLRLYRVFNVEQCEGLKLKELEAVELPNLAQRIENCERIIREMPKAPKIVHGGNAAFYRPSADVVTLPAIEAFTSTEGYYSTAFHELAHSTGHTSRLDRKMDATESFGSASYSREELVAEFCAAMLCNTVGVTNDDQVGQSAAYIDGWLRALKGDKKLLAVGAAQAQKAADWILGELEPVEEAGE